MEDMINYQLDNGMKVLLIPSNSAPVVACNVWVGVGSADETPEEAGLAHVHEHMLFKGTERRGVGQIAREVESAGGHINAFTSFDQTCYYVVMSSRYLETGLDILSDAIRHSSFEAEELARELEVIQEELKRGNDSPSRVASLKLFETAYSEHPYRLPVIGTKESIDSFKQENVLEFFHKHYVPSNMTLVLAGDFEEDQARALVDRFFADFEGATYQPVQRPQEPEQQEMRFAIMQEARQDNHLRVGFHIPAATHDDIPALEMLGTIMGQGESSVLQERVLFEQELVNGIYAGSYTPREAGLFMVSADYQLAGEESNGQAESHEHVMGAIMDEVFAFCFSEPTEQQVDRARTILESQAIYSKQTVEGLAMKLGQYDLVTGDPLFEDKYYERLGQVDAAEVMAVAKKYLKPENMTVVLSYTADNEGSQPDSLEQVVRGSYQTCASADDVEVPDTEPLTPPAETSVLDAAKANKSSRLQLKADEHGFVVERLSSGPVVLVQENHNVALFSVRALVMGGLRMETAQSNGINSMLSELVTRGTSKRSGVELARDMESMAASVAGISGRSTFGMSLTALSQFFEPSLEMFGECLLDTEIRSDEFERLKRLQLQEIHSRQDQLGAVNYDLFASEFFGDHPYSMSTSGTLESIENMKMEDLREYLGAVIDPSELVIVVVGDVDAGECIAAFDEMFKDVQAIESNLTPELSAPTRKGRKLVTADLDKNQAHIIVGFDAPTIENDDRYALELLHATLSGQGGRLFYELRDKQSLAYSVYSTMLLGVEASTFMVNIGTSPEKIEQAVKGIISEVKKLSTNPISDEELASAKRYLIGNHDIGLQRNSARAMGVALDKLYGLGHERSFEYGDRIDAVTHEQIEELVQRYLRLEDMVVSITKPTEVEVRSDLLDS